MSALSNTFEGGSSGTTITTGNSGGSSGDAFGAVTIDTGNALTYDNAQSAHGSLSAKVSTGATSGSSYAAWTSGIPGTSATLWARVYLRFSANPGAAVNALRLLSAANGIMGTVRVNANGTIGMLYSSGTLASTSTAALTTGAWFRIEVMVTAGTTTGAMTCRIYWTPDSATPDETLTISNVNTGSANPSRVRVGVVSNLANVSAFHIDDIGASDVDWIGPVAGGPDHLTLTARAPTIHAAATATVHNHAQLQPIAPGADTSAAAAVHNPAAVTPKQPAALSGIAAAVRNPSEATATQPAANAGAAAAVRNPATLDARPPAVHGAAQVTVHASGTVQATAPPADVILLGAGSGETSGILEASAPDARAQAHATVAATGQLTAGLSPIRATATGTAHNPAALDSTAAARAQAHATVAATGQLTAGLSPIRATATGTAHNPGALGSAAAPARARLAQPGADAPGHLDGTLTPSGRLAGTLAPTGRITGTLNRR